MVFGCCSSAELTAPAMLVVHWGTSTLTSLTLHCGQTLASSAFMASRKSAVAAVAFEVTDSAVNGLPPAFCTAWSTESLPSSAYGSTLT